MAKTKKQKYYAIKEGFGVKNIILENWTETEKLVKGYPSVYKSFFTREEAEKYLDNVDVNKVQDQMKKGIEHKKKLKSTTKLIQVRIPIELANRFSKECSRLDHTEESMLIDLIKEFVL